MTQSVDVEPGWYDDRYTPGVVRWFDGQAWTEHTRSVAPPEPVAPQHPAPQYVAQPFGAHPYHAGGIAPQPSAPMGAGPSDPMHWILPTGRSWQSVVAGYVGLLALVVFPLAPVAIGLGIWALRKARTGGHGRGRAVFAIVAGLVGVVVGVLVLAPGLLR
jgi:hypothetical protein